MSRSRVLRLTTALLLPLVIGCGRGGTDEKVMEEVNRRNLELARSEGLAASTFDFEIQKAKDALSEGKDEDFQLAVRNIIPLGEPAVDKLSDIFQGNRMVSTFDQPTTARDKKGDRLVAIRVIEEMGSAAKPAIPKLQSLQQDSAEEPEIRAAAEKALSGIQK
jgi:hypothetical protein